MTVLSRPTKPTRSKMVAIELIQVTLIFFDILTKKRKTNQNRKRTINGNDELTATLSGRVAVEKSTKMLIIIFLVFFF